MEDIKEIKVFLSYSREIIDSNIIEVITESIENANIFVRDYGFKFDIMHWQKNVYLGRGKPRVQDKINNKLLSICDIYLGVFWTRFGSPPGLTPEGMSYSSGTEEEFYEIKKLQDKKIWVFFCNIPKRPSEIDPEQLLKMKNFRKNLEEEQIWYKEFQNKGELKNVLLENLKEYINEKNQIKVKEKKGDFEKMPSRKDFRKLNRGF